MSRTSSWPATAAQWLAVGLLSVAQFPHAASPQQAAATSPELIDAILRYTYRFEGGNVRLINGRVPDDLGPNFYAPPDTRVLGSVVMGAAVLVFATSATPVDSLRAMYTRALAPAGWRPLTPFRAGGFVESPQGQPLRFCRDGAQLHIQATRVSGLSDLVLSYRDGMGMCQQPSEATFATMRARPDFPTLHAPDDAGRGRQRCYAASGGMASATEGAATGTVVATTMSAAELLRYYARQLESSGWRPASDTGAETAAGTWVSTDSSAVKRVTLEVATRGARAIGCYDVQMRLSQGPR